MRKKSQSLSHHSFYRSFLPLLCLLIDCMVGIALLADSASSRAPLDPNRPPTITEQPQSRAVNLGETASFSVTATGTPPLFYQWRRNVFGSPVEWSGATNATLVFSSVQHTNAGVYSVTVANASGTTTSAEAQLIVRLPPTIMVQPQSRTVPVGSVGVFSVQVAGTGPYQYQWLRDGRDLPGATNLVLVLQNVQLADAGEYGVRVSNALGSVTSAVAQLILVEAPRITAQPQNQKVPIGATATFNVAASGVAPFRFQWRFDEADLPSATNATLVIPAVQFSDTGAYAVRISGVGGFVTSAEARLSLDVSAEAPTITLHPQGQPVAAGTNVTLRVAATGTPPLQYQWRMDGRELIGGTNDFLELKDFQAANAGGYSVRVSNAAGGIASKAAQLSLLGPPTIRTQPRDEAASPGSQISFRVDAFGVGPLLYQWRFNGKDLPNATSHWLILTNVQPGDAGVYSLQVTGPGGSVNSADARLSVFDPNAFPKVTWLPFIPLAAIGTNVTLAVAASGAPPLHFQWLRNGRELPGANSSILVLNNVQPADAGIYSVKVSNAAGTSTSPTMPLMILATGSSLIQNGFVIRLGGPAGASVRLQASADMRTWTTLIRLTFTDQPIEYVDVEARDNARRFYRALIGP